MQDIRDAMLVGRSSDGSRIERPLSPHLQVYRWPITMAQSILHRITGISLGAAALLLVTWLVTAASGPGPFGAVQWFVASPIGLAILFLFTLALFYHLAAGLRHLFWDAVIGFEKPQFTASSYWIYAFALLATAFVWVVGFFMLGR